MQYHINLVQVMDLWTVSLSRTTTAAEAAQGLGPWVERAYVAAKPYRDPDLDAMTALAWALDEWFRVAAERSG